MAGRKGFKIADAFVEIHADRDSLKDDTRRLGSDVGPDFDREGQKLGKRLGKGIGKGAGDESKRQGGGVGDKLSQGIHLSLVRNSPLIAAAIGGALAVGAPLALAGATTLFAGIGAVAAAQSDRVRSAWIGLWSEIKQGAQNDAAVLVPVYERMAYKIGAGFDRLRPKFREIFADSAPMVDRFTDSIVRMAENAMPGFTRAVDRAGPVMEGFGSFLESTGTGLTRFFDAMSEHSPAAGAAFDALGQIVANLLPILGELLGQGAELAAVVLPPVAQILGVVAEAAAELGDFLPMLVTGFAALKIAQAAGGWLSTFSGQVAGAGARLAAMSWQGEVANIGMGKLSRAAAAVGRSLPVIGVAALGVEHALTAADEAQEEMTAGFGEWMRALRGGGAAADEAREKIAILQQKLDDYEPEWGGVDVGAAFQKAADEARKYTENLTPTEAATERLSAATRTLDEVLGDESASADEVAAAQREVEAATAASEAAQAELEMALYGVTAAMVEQTNQAMAAIDSGFGYRNAVNQLEDAQTALNDAIKENGRNSEEAQRAGLALEEQNYAVAAAYGKQQADLSGLAKDTEDYGRLIQVETLAELYRLRDAAGPQMAGAIQQQIDMLERSGVSLNETAAKAAATAGQMRNLGLQVEMVPGYRFVQIDAPTAAQRQQIADLGYAVHTLPNGRVIVYANTAPARQEIAAFMAANAARRITVGLFGAPRGATGGNVGAISKGYSGGGKLSGPGSPTSDSIPARTMSGRNVAFSDDEWVIRAMAAKKYGDALMAEVNAGTAIIASGRATGGRVSERQMATGVGTGTVIHVGSVVVKVETPMNLMDPRSLRTAGEKIREIIIGLEREQS